MFLSRFRYLKWMGIIYVMWWLIIFWRSPNLNVGKPPFPRHPLLINSRGIAFWSNPTASFSVNYESDIITCLLRSRKWSLTIPSKLMNTQSWPFDVIADSGSCVGSVPSWSLSVFLEMGKNPPNCPKPLLCPSKITGTLRAPQLKISFVGKFT